MVGDMVGDVVGLVVGLVLGLVVGLVVSDVIGLVVCMFVVGYCHQTKPGEICRVFELRHLLLRLFFWPFLWRLILDLVRYVV